MRKFAVIGLPFRLSKWFIDYVIEKTLLVLKIVGLRGLFYLATIAGLYYYYHSKSLDVLLPIIIGIFISDLLKTLYNNLLITKEDKLKTTHNPGYLKGLYQDHYDKTLKLNGAEIKFLYECCVHNDNYQIQIQDQPDTMFELDPFIKSSYSEIMRAHKGSYIKNFETIRLDGFSLESNTLTLMTSRSNYYKHLLTNRAIDYEIERNISIRKIFEYGPLLSKFENSKMSNHIGINGIVLLNDGYTLIPKRSAEATYVTAGI